MKLHLFGAAGTGVTTLGKALAKQLKVPYFDTDDYFWLKTSPPFTSRRNSAERNLLIVDDLKKQKDYILGGSVIHWGDGLFPPFDLVVFLYLPQAIRIERLIEREYKIYGDKIFYEPERKLQFEKFIAWAKDYDENQDIANRTYLAHKKWLENSTDPILAIDGDCSTNDRMTKVLQRLYEDGLLPDSININL